MSGCSAHNSHTNIEPNNKIAVHYTEQDNKQSQHGYYAIIEYVEGQWEVKELSNVRPERNNEAQEILIFSKNKKIVRPSFDRYEEDVFDKRFNLFGCVFLDKMINGHNGYHPCTSKLMKINVGSSIHNNAVSAILSWGLASNVIKEIDQEKILNIIQETDLLEKLDVYIEEERIARAKKIKEEERIARNRRIKEEKKRAEEEKKRKLAKVKQEKIALEQKLSKYKQEYAKASGSDNIKTMASFINKYTRQDYDPLGYLPIIKDKLAKEKRRQDLKSLGNMINESLDTVTQ